MSWDEENADSDEEPDWAKVDGHGSGAQGNLDFEAVFSEGAGDPFDFDNITPAGGEFFNQSPISSPEKTFTSGAAPITSDSFFAAFPSDPLADSKINSETITSSTSESAGFFSFASFPSAVGDAGPSSPDGSSENPQGSDPVAGISSIYQSKA